MIVIDGFAAAALDLQCRPCAAREQFTAGRATQVGEL
jgi:hypothetical protein